MKSKRFLPIKLFATGIIGITLCSWGAEPVVSQGDSVGLRVTGTVVDATDDHPVPDVRVTIEGKNLRTTTDTEGQFRLGDIPPGSYRLILEKNGYSSFHQNPTIGNGAVLLKLTTEDRLGLVLQIQRAGVMTGLILDEQGDPVQGARIVPFWREYSEAGTPVVRTFPGTNTDDLGQFRVTNLRPGRYHLRIDSPNIPNQVALSYPSGDASEGIAVESGSEVRLSAIQVRSAAAGMLKVRLTDGVRTDSTSVMIRIYQNEQLLVSRLMKLTFGKIEDIGLFSPGLCEVEIETETGRYGEGSVVVSATPSTADIALSEYSLIVADTRGAETPLKGNLILQFVDLVAKTGRPPTVLTVQSGFDGGMRLPKVPPGRYRVDVVETPAGHFVQSITSADREVLGEGLAADAGETRLTVTLARPGAAIDGTVFRNSNEKAPGVLVVLMPARSETPNIVRKTTTDEAGYFHLDGLPPGSYRLYSWSQLPGAAYRSSEFMSRYKEKGTDVTLHLGEQQTVSVTAINQ